MQPVPFEGNARLDAASLSFKGSATDQAAEASASLSDLPLSLASPYLAQLIAPTLEGVLTARLGLNWKAASAANAPAQLLLQLPSVTLDKLTFSAGRNPPLASLKQLQLESVALDLTRQTATLGRVRLNQPKTHLTRAQNGRWMFEDWLEPRPVAAAPAASSMANVTTSEGPGNASSTAVVSRAGRPVLGPGGE